MPLELAPEIGIEKDQDSASSAPPSQIVVSLGKQILGEYTNCQNLPSSPEELEQYMLHAAKLMGATIVSSVFHKLNPTGLSGVVVIAESHFAIHTWPEHHCASIDLFSCSKLNEQIGLDYLKSVFKAERLSVIAVPRGIGELIKEERSKIHQNMIYS